MATPARKVLPQLRRGAHTGGRTHEKNLCRLATFGLVAAASLGGAAAFAQGITIGVSFDKVEPFREAQIKALDAAIAAAGVSFRPESLEDPSSWDDITLDRAEAVRE